MNYPTYTTESGEKLQILPGSRFSKRELSDRLSLMKIPNPYKDRPSMIQLYEESLNVQGNLSKILQKLRADTEEINAKFNHGRPASMYNQGQGETILNKVINIQTNMEPYGPIEHHVNLTHRHPTNNQQLVENPFLTTSQISNNEENINTNNYNNNNNNQYSQNIFLNRNNRAQHSYAPGNESNANQQKSGLNFQERPGSYSNSNRYSQNFNEERESSNTPEFVSFSGNNNGKKINSNPDKNIPPKKFIEDNDDNERPKNFFTQINTQGRLSTQPNNTMDFNNNYNYERGNQNNINRNTINVIDNRQAVFAEGGEGGEGGDDNNNPAKDFDAETNYSRFSAFKSFYHDKVYKNRREILKYMARAAIIAFIIASAIYVINNYGSEIGNSVTAFFNNLFTNPREILVNGVFGFIAGVFFGLVRYFYITVPLLIIAIGAIIYYHKKKFETKLNAIMEAIIDELKKTKQNNDGIRMITESELIKRMAQMFKINPERFQKKYWPALKILRRDRVEIKMGTYKDENENVIKFWYLNE